MSHDYYCFLFWKNNLKKAIEMTFKFRIFIIVLMAPYNLCCMAD